MDRAFHPVAEIFPLMDGREFDELAADVGAHGLREPIWLHPDGRIIDGRNRFRACAASGVEPHLRTWQGGGSLVAFVVSLNLRRRHLTKSQRAMVAARLANLQRGDNQHAPIGATSQSDAAELLNVSRRNLQRARAVQEGGTPELVALVVSGKVSVTAASTVAEAPEDEQRELVARGEREILQAAKDIRARNKNIATKWTGDPECYTPAKYIEAARAVMGGIDLDPASNELAQKTVNATKWYDEASDGLAQEWRGRVFLNPPYAHPTVAHFIDKLCDEFEAGRVTAAVLLTNNNTDTKWWHRAFAAAAVCFTAGRIHFYKGDGGESQPTNGQTFFYFGEDVEGFAAVFTEFGLVGEMRATGTRFQ